MKQPPKEVRDVESWNRAQELDCNGVDLTRWECDFLESLLQQLLQGRTLTEKQRKKLELIIEERVR